MSSQIETNNNSNLAKGDANEAAANKAIAPR